MEILYGLTHLIDFITIIIVIILINKRMNRSDEKMYEIEEDVLKTIEKQKNYDNYLLTHIHCLKCNRGIHLFSVDSAAYDNKLCNSCYHDFIDKLVEENKSKGKK